MNILKSLFAPRIDMKGLLGKPRLPKESDLAGQLYPMWSWSLTDIATGEIVKESGWQKSESLLAGFLAILFAQMKGEGWGTDRLWTPIKDFSGASGVPGMNSYNFYVKAGIGITDYGMLVGSTNAGVAFDDEYVTDLIAHGAGAGQLQYGATTFGEPSSDGTTSQFRTTRVFSNGSGAAVTVGNVAVLVYCNFVGHDYQGVAAGDYSYVAILRDIWNPVLSIPNGQALTVNYSLQCSV